VTGGERVFVDTNVLVYANDRAELRRRPLALARLDELWRTRTGVISTQVLQEFYVVATRRLNPAMPRAIAREIVVAYAEWSVVQVDSSLVVAASLLEEEHTLSFWDALIIESAHRAGAGRLVSEDFQEGRRFGEMVVENPFTS